jgi:hypothetical protein
MEYWSDRFIGFSQFIEFIGLTLAQIWFSVLILASSLVLGRAQQTLNMWTAKIYFDQIAYDFTEL